jgi:hypothetical protein
MDSDVDGVEVDPIVDVEERVTDGRVDEPIEVDPHEAVTVSVVVRFCVQHPPLITFVMFVYIWNMLVTYDPPPHIVLGVSEQGWVMVLGFGVTVIVAVVIVVVVAVAVVVAVVVAVKVPQNDELDGATAVVLGDDEG